MYHPFIHLMLCSRLRLPLTIEDIIISLLFLSQGTLDWISSSRTGNDVVDVVNFLLKEIKFPPPKKKKFPILKIFFEYHDKNVSTQNECTKCIYTKFYKIDVLCTQVSLKRIIQIISIFN